MKSLTTKFKVHNYRNNNEQVIQPLFDPNQAMRFDDKTDEEFINSSNHKTNLPIEELISNPEQKRKNKKGKIPRRLNNWIIYRRDKRILFKELGLTEAAITEKVSKMWDNEPEEVKEFYSALSRLAVKKHIKIYGHEYKYRPGPYRKRNKTTKRKLSPSSEESSPNISESMDTTSSSSSSPLESMQLLSDMVSGFSFFQTPELIPDSPATSSVSGSDYDYSLGSAFPPLSAISRSKPPPSESSLFQFPSSIHNFDYSLDSMQANVPLFNISYSGVDTNAVQLPDPEELFVNTNISMNTETTPHSALDKLLSTFTEQLPDPEELFVDTNISMNTETTSHSALDKLLSTFTEQQKQLYSEVVQLPIEHNHDLYPSKENIEHQELLNANTYNQDQTNMQHMVYNDIQQCADSTNLMDNNDVLLQQYDWLLYDVDFDYLDSREPSL